MKNIILATGCVVYTLKVCHMVVIWDSLRLDLHLLGFSLTIVPGVTSSATEPGCSVSESLRWTPNVNAHTLEPLQPALLYINTVRTVYFLICGC